MKRRLLASVLLSALLDPLALWSVSHEPAHECRDHVCACASHCPPRRELPCHGSQAPSRGMSAACDHDEVPGLAAGAPAVLPAEGLAPPAAVATAVARVVHVGVGWRSTPPDPPPPEAA